MSKFMKGKKAPLLALFFMVLSPACLAATLGDSSLDSIVKIYRDSTEVWEPIIHDLTMGLFWGLVTISFVWSSCQLLLKGGGLVDVIADLEGDQGEARHVPEDVHLGGLQDTADLGRARALGVKGLGRVAGGDDVRSMGDDDLELLGGDILDLVDQDVAILFGRVEEVVDRADFDVVGAGFGQTHGREVLQGVGVREVAYLGPAVLLEQQDGRMGQDDGLARAGIAFDPMPTRHLGRGLADDEALSRGEVFEGYEPVHGCLWTKEPFAGKHIGCIE